MERAPRRCVSVFVSGVARYGKTVCERLYVHVVLKSVPNCCHLACAVLAPNLCDEAEPT